MAVRVAILLLVLCVGRSQGPPLRDLSKLAEQMDDASISFNIYWLFRFRRPVSLSLSISRTHTALRLHCLLLLLRCLAAFFKIHIQISTLASVAPSHSLTLTALRFYSRVAYFVLSLSCCFFFKKCIFKSRHDKPGRRRTRHTCGPRRRRSWRTGASRARPRASSTRRRARPGLSPAPCTSSRG